MISVRNMYLRNIWWNFRHRRYNLFSISEGDYISTINDEMLKYAIDNGILNPELIFAQVEMEKEIAILNNIITKSGITKNANSGTRIWMITQNEAIRLSTEVLKGN